MAMVVRLVRVVRAVRVRGSLHSTQNPNIPCQPTSFAAAIASRREANVLACTSVWCGDVV